MGRLQLMLEEPSPEFVSVKAKETAMMIVDMQKDFVEDSGALYVGPSVKDVVPKIRVLLDKARHLGVKVIYTQDWHSEDDPEFRIWPKHCVRESHGAQFVDDLRPREGDLAIRKTTYDPFFNTDLDSRLSNLKLNSLIVTGTVSNICVLHAVSGATLHGIHVIVPSDCIAPIAVEDQVFALRQFKNVYNARITTLSQLEIRP